MITQLRIDDRLFHGEIIVLWVPSLKVNSVVVADDEYYDYINLHYDEIRFVTDLK